MPRIQLDFKVYDPLKGFSEFDFRDSFILGNHKKEKFTKKDYVTIAKRIIYAMIEYNRGKRGNQWEWSQDENKTQSLTE